MTDPVLEIEDASVMRGEALALDRLTLRIDAGEHCAILGANGSGKSTLVQLAARQLYPLSGGKVRIFGRTDWTVAELRSRLGIVSPSLQSDYAGRERLEVFDAVVSGFFASRGLWKNHRVTAEMRSRSREALERMGIARLVGRDMATLSTGEARRVLIARALVHRPRALLLDEPCGGLDPVSRRTFLEALRVIARTGTTLLMITHHVEEIIPEIGSVVMLRDGRVLHQGPKADLLRDAPMSETFAAPVRVERRGEWYGAQLD